MRSCEIAPTAPPPYMTLLGNCPAAPNPIVKPVPPATQTGEALTYETRNRLLWQWIVVMNETTFPIGNQRADRIHFGNHQQQLALVLCTFTSVVGK